MNPESLIDPLFAEALNKFIERNINRNRTIVSDDNVLLLNDIKKLIPIKIYRFASGKKFETWTVPPSWNLETAELSVNGLKTVTEKDSALFIAPYSKDVNCEITLEELLKKTAVHETQDDAFKYEHRIASDPSKRLKEWKISLPKNIIRSIKVDSKISLLIKSTVKKGSLLVGVYKIKGKSKSEIALISHYCHPGQLNDGLSGLIVSIVILEYLRKSKVKTNFTYSLITFPETIGSSIFLASDKKHYRNILSTIFSEMSGSKTKLQLVKSRRDNLYIDRVSEFAMREVVSEFRVVGFKEGWGNDEMVFDSPGIAVPSISVDRFPFEFYHSSNDNLDNFDFKQLEEIAKIYLRIIEIIENDYIPKIKYRTPIYLSNFGLYSDWTLENKDYVFKQTILDNLDKNMSIFDISYTFDLDYKKVLDFITLLEHHNLIKRQNLTRKYFVENAFNV